MNQLFLTAQYLIRILIGGVILLQSFSSVAIVMRHDIDHDEYLLDSSDYQSVVHSENSSATLIAPKWVLASAHAFDPGFGHSVESFGKITIMGQQVEVNNVFVHPAYNFYDQINDGPINDLALVELAQPFDTVVPTPPYEGFDEIGKTMKLAGYGHLGDGVNGIYSECFPCELHGADNLVFDANEDLIGIQFESPDSQDIAELEGIGAPGDSGGPLFIETSTGRF